MAVCGARLCKDLREVMLGGADETCVVLGVVAARAGGCVGRHGAVRVRQSEPNERQRSVAWTDEQNETRLDGAIQRERELRRGREARAWFWFGLVCSC